MVTAARRTPRLVALAVRTTRGAGFGLVAGIGALQLLSIAGLVAQLLAARRLIAEFTTSNPATHRLIIPATVLVIAFALSAAGAAVASILQHLLGERVSRHALSIVLSAATRTDLIEFESSVLHDRLQRALLNAASRPTQMTLGLMSVVSSLGTFSVLAVAVLLISPVLFAVVVVLALPLTVIAFGSSRALFDFAVEQTEGDRQRLYLQLLIGSRDQAKEVRAYGLGPVLLARWHRSYGLRLHQLNALLARRARRALLAVTVSTIALGIALATLAWLITSHRLSFASGATAAAALLVMSRQAQTLAAGTANLYETGLFMQDYRYFSDELDRGSATRSVDFATNGAADKPSRGRHHRGAHVLGHTTQTAGAPASFDSLHAHEVSFTYPSGHRPAVANVSMHIERGEIVALVGENGSGKSTLAKLIAGLYEPQTGTLTWNGQNYRDLDPDEIRRHVAVLFQDFIKFQMSVRENITMGDPQRAEHPVDLVRAAAEASGAAQFVNELPAGYDTELGPQFVNGTELSGGQWQRLALARAAFRPASLVILDEPTAALDPRAEERLFQATRDVFADRAVLLISHRFSSVRRADRIYVLSAGHITETGSHDELVAQGGLYSELYRAQHEALLGPV